MPAADVLVTVMGVSDTRNAAELDGRLSSALWMRVFQCSSFHVGFT
jgi:hypothetical protein